MIRQFSSIVKVRFAQFFHEKLANFIELYPYILGCSAGGRRVFFLRASNRRDEEFRSAVLKLP